MKKIFHPFALFAALCLALLGCLHEEETEPPHKEEERGVVIRFAAGTDGSSAAADNAVMFNSGYLLMTNGGGTIVRQFDIRSGAGLSNPDAGYLYLDELESDKGVLLTAVPSTVRRIVIVGNTVLTPAPAVGSNIAAVRAQSINVASQHDSNNVNLWGEADDTETDRSRHSFWHFTGTTAPHRLYEVRVALFPTVARMELHRIEACPDSQIAAFKVEAIFIDRHYLDAHVSGAIPGANVEGHSNFISRGQNADLFRAGERGYDDDTHLRYPTGGALFDLIGINATGAGTDAAPLAVTIPGHGAPTRNRWAYRLFAMQRTVDASGVVTSRGTRMPAIVIRLSEVRLRGATEAMTGYRYLTIRGLIVNNELLPGIHALHVYEVEPVRFTEDDLRPYPNRHAIDVPVRVTLATWQGEKIVSRPGFSQPSPPNKMLSGYQSEESRTFALGAAVCGYCTVPIAYLWQQSIDGGGTWTEAVPGVGDNRSQHFVTAILTQNTHFRRVAICGCGRRYTHPALVTVDNDDAQKNADDADDTDLRGFVIAGLTRNPFVI